MLCSGPDNGSGRALLQRKSVRMIEATLNQDVQTVTPEGECVERLPAGVTFHDVVTHVDGRGSVVELYVPRWGWHSDPLVFSYCFTVRPGMIKGWGLHKKHDDRYFILFGELETVLYDERSDSPTRGLVAKVVISEYRRRLLNIPAGVWHANPDKYRLPLDNDHIPYKFDDLRGW